MSKALLAGIMVIGLLTAVGPVGGCETVQLRDFHPLSLTMSMTRGVSVGDRAYFPGLRGGNTAVVYDVDAGKGVLLGEFPGILKAGAGALLLLADQRSTYPYYYRISDGQVLTVPNAKSFDFHFDDYVFLQNDVFYATEGRGESQDLVKIDFARGTTKRLFRDATPYAMASDRMHLLVGSPGGVQIWGTSQDAKIASVAAWAIITDPCLQFLTNNVFMTFSTDAPNTIQIWGIDGAPLEPVVLQVPNDARLSSIWFTDDLASAHISIYDKGSAKVRTGFIDSSAFKEYVSRKYGFGRYGGEVNASQLRLREYPNTDARTLGYLSKGDGVMVVDRSSLKVKIGATEEYWYRVRTTSGVEGWAYGAYVDLREELHK